jgi:VanZ family protein
VAATVAQSRGSTLARYLLAAYTMLVVYASLHPLSGWNATGVGPFAFLAAPLPRYVFRLDIFANILGYAPFGFLAVVAAYPRWRRANAVALATASAVLLSFALEALQSYLPSRTPSNLDFAANSVGAIAGALLGARLSNSPLEHAIKAVRYRQFRPGRRIDLGLVLLGLWLFTQLDPQTLLFGGGDLRRLLQDPAAELHTAEVFIRAEALVAAFNALAVGLVAALLTARGRRIRTLVVGLVALALLVHAAAYAVLFGPQETFHWLTPGAYFGVGAGVLLLLAATALPRPAQLALCAVALMAGAVLVNITPENPYLAASLSTWRQGYFEHFVGLTRLISGAWPFLALVYVVSLAGARGAGGDPERPL